MPQIINTNILALNAQRQLNKSQASQATSIERLSSGLRINSAKDDAAGLAISTRFETQVRGLNQAIRNANDGISLAQTAEGSLQEMGNIMQRMRELAVQSANDTNSDQDRLSLQSEVDQLYNELERISDSTEFNGVKLLDGSAGERRFQVGANAGQSISFNVESVTTQGLDLNNFSGTGDLNGGRVSAPVLGNLAANTLEINNVAINAFTSTGDGTSITAFKNALNEQTQATGVTANAYNVVTGSSANGTTSGLIITVGGIQTTVADSASVQELADNINRDVAGLNASVEAGGAIQLTNNTGQTIAISGATSGSGLEAGEYNGYLSLTSTDNTEIKVSAGSAGTAADLQALGFNASEGSAKITGASFEAAAITDADKITINGVELGTVALSTEGTQGFNVVKAINDISSQTGVTATAGATTATSAINLTKLDAAGVNEILVNGVDVGGGTYADTLAFATALNTTFKTANPVAFGDLVATVDSNDNLVLTSASGADINIDQNVGAFSSLKNTEFRSGVVTPAGADGAGGLVINGTEITGTPATIELLATAITAAVTDVTATVDADTNEIVLTSNNGAEITVTSDNDTFASVGKAANGLFTAAISLESTTGEDIILGSNATADATLTVGTRGATVFTDAITASLFNTIATVTSAIAINGVLISAAEAGYTDNAAGRELLTTNINTLMADNGFDIVATIDGSDMTLTSASGQDIIINQGAAIAGFTTTATGGVDVGTYSEVTLTTGVTAEQQQSAAVAKLGLTGQGGNEEVTGLGLSITTVSNANAAIEKIDAALDKVSSVRAGLGAFQNRLGSTIANLENVSQNLSAANSRIRDADFAVETANLTKTQILQQAGIAMLSQANASQQNVLSLLG